MSKCVVAATDGNLVCSWTLNGELFAAQKFQRLSQLDGSTQALGKGNRASPRSIFDTIAQ